MHLALEVIGSMTEIRYAIVVIRKTSSACLSSPKIEGKMHDAYAMPPQLNAPVFVKCSYCSYTRTRESVDL